MKKPLLLLFILSNFYLFSQNNTSSASTVIKNFGTVYTIENPDLLLDRNKTYKILFDVYTDSNKLSDINPLINTVARFINMHSQTGVPLENINIAMVMHGKATKDVLNSDAFFTKYGNQNPNTELLSALKKVNVHMYVCGQSFKSNAYNLQELDENVKMALSALTVLVKYQSEGYQLITFN